MRRMGLAAAAILVCVTAAHAKLEIQNIQAVYGELGPVRPSLEVYPQDELVFRFTIVGARRNDEGKTEAALTMRLTNASDKELLDQTSPLTVLPALGAESFPAYARITIGTQVPVGEYTLKVTVADKLAEKQGPPAEFERKIQVKQPTFAIISPRFSYDPDGKIGAPAGGMVGQNLFVRFKVIGFSRAGGQIDTTMQLQVLDAEGKPLLQKPISGAAKKDDAKVVEKVHTLTFTGGIALNRPGKFTLRVTVTDLIGKATTKLELPLQVTAP